MYKPPVLLSNMITNNIINRIVRIRYGDKYGSGFTIDHRDKQYLISAKHIFPKIEDGDNIQYYHSGEWKSLAVNTVKGIPKDIDQIIFNLDSPITTNPPIILHTQFELAHEVFFLGFPLGRMVDDEGINNSFPLPYVKHGIIAGADEQRIYIDAHGNKGFSGGPLVISHYDREGICQMYVIGVMSGYLYDVIDGTNGTYNQRVNSGICYACSIKHALECMEVDFLHKRTQSV